MGQVNTTGKFGGLKVSEPKTPQPQPNPAGDPSPPTVPNGAMTAGVPSRTTAGASPVNNSASQTVKGDKYTNASQKFLAPVPVNRNTDPGLIVEQGPASGTLPDQTKLSDMSGTSPKPPLPATGGLQKLSGKANWATLIGLVSIGVAAGLGAATTHNAPSPSESDEA